MRKTPARPTLARVTHARGLGCVLLVVAGAVACGPSFQVVYECDVRFEHCYAIDQSAVQPDAKKDCWREWLHGYTYGQSRDRIEFAATRFSELSLDPTLPNEDVRGPKPRRIEHPVAAPVPTNAFAPPPNVSDGKSSQESPASLTKAVAKDPPVRDAPVRAPGSDCAQTCGDKWSACRAPCKDRACDACDKAYRGCMPACFHDEATAGHPPKSSH